MITTTFLARGDGPALASRVTSGLVDAVAAGAGGAAVATRALVLLTLGASDRPGLLRAVRGAGVRCPIYLAETYGVLGYDPDLGRNVELMEKGRGSEYGYRGGSGGQGCVVVAYDGEGGNTATAGHGPSFPKDASSLMVIADTSGAFSDVSGAAPLHYGGVAKECFVATTGVDLEKIPYFWVAAPQRGGAVGVTAFTAEAGPATKSILAKMPPDRRPSGVFGLFPCYTRGVNHYGAENVESDAIASVATDPPDLRIYGMFAHGELGPSSFSGFTNEANNIPCEKHSMTSILSVHTCEDGENE